MTYHVRNSLDGEKVLDIRMTMGVAKAIKDALTNSIDHGVHGNENFDAIIDFITIYNLAKKEA